VNGFTYEPPDFNSFFKALLVRMKADGLKEIAELLEGGSCEIVHYGQFSRKRWNAYRTEIILRVPIEKYEEVLSKITPKIKQKIVTMADEIMPKNAGLDVMEISLTPSLEATSLERSLISDIEVSPKRLLKGISQEILPKDIIEKGKEMADVYVYLYCVENAMRLFIEKVARNAYGDDFFDRLKISKDPNKKLKSRKEDERKNKWLPIRGDSDIFYLDFQDLGSLIRDNWELFEEYFPSQDWIVTKIKDLSKCRNLVAHNSYIGQEERDLVRSYFNTIMKQIGLTFQ